MRYIPLKVDAVYVGKDEAQRRVLFIHENEDIDIEVVKTPPLENINQPVLPVGAKRTVQRITFMRWVQRGPDRAPLEV